MQLNEGFTQQSGIQQGSRAAAAILDKGRGTGESLAEVTHDARNLVAALGLYCDLLETPGVLAVPYTHYGDELRLVATASRRLVQRLAGLQGGVQDAAPRTATAAGPRLVGSGSQVRHTAAKCWEMIPAASIQNMAVQLLATRNLLATLAGSAIQLTMDVQGAELPVHMTGEDLTRVLINLVKNSTEAMPRGGHIRLSLREIPSRPGKARWLTLTVEDNGPGIPDFALDKLFEPGFSTRGKECEPSGLHAQQRGLGLSITRSIIRAAGGCIHAANRDPSGACFQIGLPVKGR